MFFPKSENPAIVNMAAMYLPFSLTRQIKRMMRLINTMKEEFISVAPMFAILK